MEEGILLNDRYQLIDRLGSGGMADVFRARDLMLDRYVAIKALRKDYSINPEFQNHFKMEARSAANILDYDCTQGNPNANQYYPRTCGKRI